MATVFSTIQTNVVAGVDRLDAPDQSSPLTAPFCAVEPIRKVFLDADFASSIALASCSKKALSWDLFVLEMALDLGLVAPDDTLSPDKLPQSIQDWFKSQVLSRCSDEIGLPEGVFLADFDHFSSSRLGEYDLPSFESVLQSNRLKELGLDEPFYVAEYCLRQIVVPLPFLSNPKLSLKAKESVLSEVLKLRQFGFLDVVGIRGGLNGYLHGGLFRYQEQEEWSEYAEESFLYDQECLPDDQKLSFEQYAFAHPTSSPDSLSSFAKQSLGGMALESKMPCFWRSLNRCAPC